MHVRVAPLLFLLKISLQSAPDDDSYVAAVIEFSFPQDDAETQYQYIQFIKEAKGKGADIIVFPEMDSLTKNSTTVSVPVFRQLKTCSIPALCPSMFDEYLVLLSSAARENNIYVVVNLHERLDCTAITGEYCPEDKVYFFNTNVVFDRSGAVIDRYRKTHLFDEALITPSLDHGLGMFTTDFGVTFGHVICFDSMFQTPLVQLVQRYNITNVIIPNMWVNHLPFLIAPQVHQWFAYVMNINLMAAGGNDVATSSSGSGIFSGKAGPLVGFLTGVPTSRLFVATVPKVPGRVTQNAQMGFIQGDPSDMDSLLVIGDSSLSASVTRPLVKGLQEFTLVHNHLTCKFRVILSDRKEYAYKHYEYRAIAFNGVRDAYNEATIGMRTCAVIACIGTTITSCAKRPDHITASTSAMFKELIVEAVAPAPRKDAYGMDDSMISAHTLSTTLLPLSPQDYSYTVDKDRQVDTHRVALTNNNAELYTFGVWGRVYDLDGFDADYVSAPVQRIPFEKVYHIATRRVSVATLTLFCWLIITYMK